MSSKGGGSSRQSSSKKGPVSSPEDRRKAGELVERLKGAGTPSKGLSKVLSDDEVQWLIDKASALFLKESSLLECDPPVTLCGDTHGQFSDVLRIFTTFGWPGDGKSRYLFLGKSSFAVRFD